MDRRKAIRPTKTRAIQPFSLTEYRAMTKRNFLHNLQSGFFQDLTKKIEEAEIITRTGLDHALSEAEKSVKSIDLFLADQLKDNSSLEGELRTVIAMKRKKKAELDLALKKMGDLKVDLFKRIESIRETMQCRDFLHKVAPRAWLADYQGLIEKHKATNQPKIDGLNREFDDFMRHMAGMDKEVEKIVKEFMEICQNSGPELVPFKEGKEISGVIKKMEKNNMEMLVHVRGLQKPLAEGRATLNGIKAVCKAEIGEVCRTLKEMTENFTFLKERNARLESVMHDLMKCYKQQVASPDVLKDRALLESLYKSVVGTKTAKSSVLEMWKEIDAAFTDIRCKVGSFSKVEIERRRIGINELNLRQLKEAEKARNRVLQMEQMVCGSHSGHQHFPAPSGRCALARSHLRRHPRLLRLKVRQERITRLKLSTSRNSSNRWRSATRLPGRVSPGVSFTGGTASVRTGKLAALQKWKNPTTRCRGKIWKYPRCLWWKNL
ncbi:unnamed protein product [Nesidiocoris tenuis]|uniref:Uncharacterized protein n=1 Tax=Nesidiocoris tenuis TaxID=355587 RepID=A0A6H5GSU9_9HEMI|nr:unnamed protein product [Nesidiocoris tenuis]